MVKKWHWFLIVFVILSIGIVGFFWNAFHGNPWGERKAKEKIVAYLKEEYPGQTFEVKRVFYNFKFSSYEGEVVEKGKNIPPFFVSTDKNGVSYDEYKYEHAMDKPLVQKFSKEAGDMIAATLKPNVTDIESISVDIYVKKDKYPKDTVYQKETKEKISAEIVFHNKDKAYTKKDFIEKSFVTLLLLKGANYNLERVSFYSYHEFQGDGYSILLQENEFDISEEKMMKYKTLQDYKKINAQK